MRGEIIYKLLSNLEERAIDMIDLIDVFISSGYGASMGKIEYEFSRKAVKRTENKRNKEKVRNIKKYLSKLEKNGLIIKNSINKIDITSKGKRKLNVFKKSFLLNKTQYKKEKSDNIIVISYDIPVAFNKERNILRDILRYLNFNLIHKSVWIGRTKLPKEFILDMEKLGILDYIEILEVTKNGSLKSEN
jgi:hypothetical protein